MAETLTYDAGTNTVTDGEGNNLTPAEQESLAVGEELVSAHRFYLRMGAKPVSKVEIHGNVGSTVYVYKIS